MTSATGDFVLTTDELRAVARFVAESAEPLLPHFAASCPTDDPPAEAVRACWRFVGGERRTTLQRVTSLDAHRAAAAAPDEVARLAAQAAGDAASAAYLHPIAKAHQVGHLLRAAANAARIAELLDPDAPDAADDSLHAAVARATPVLVDVLSRYPVPTPGRSRASQLMGLLDSRLRSLA